MYLSIVVGLLGLLTYLASTNPKLQEIGRVSYFAGLLSFLLDVARTLGVLPR